MVLPRRLLATLTLALVAHAAHAERSRLGEDDFAQRGECELELARTRQTARGAAAERESAMQLDCGIGWRTELVLGIARRRGGGERADAFELEARTSMALRQSAAPARPGTAARTSSGSMPRGGPRQLG